MPSSVPAPALPPLPWPSAWAWPRTTYRLVWAAVVAIAAAAYGVAIERLMITVVAGLVAFVCLTIWIDTRRRYHGATLVNAVTLTEAKEMPPDSWVHLLRERRRGFSLIVLFALMALIFGGIGVLGLVRDPVKDDTPIFVLRAASAGILLVGVLFAAGFVRSLIGRKRLGSFGERPLGIALGENALLIVTVTGVDAVPWSDIVGIRPEQRAARRRAGESPGAMWLKLSVRRSDGATTPLMLAVESSDVHPWVIYTAVTLAVTDASFRTSLGSSRAQAQLDAWSSAVAELKRRKP